MKGAIIYEGKYGATQQYATWLGESLGLPVFETANAGPAIIARFDYLLLGASIYFGKMLNKEWMERNEGHLAGKKLFYFIVCGTPPTEKQKLEQIVDKNIPARLLQPASIWFLKGRIIVDKLSWRDRMMLKMGARLEKNLDVRKNMLHDFDEVRKENLTSIINSATTYAKEAKDGVQKLQASGK